MGPSCEKYPPGVLTQKWIQRLWPFPSHLCKLSSTVQPIVSPLESFLSSQPLARLNQVLILKEIMTLRGELV